MSRTRNTADLVSLNAINATGGKVGIGTTARSNQLYVKGSTEIIGILTATSFTGSGANLTNLNGSNISSLRNCFSAVNHCESWCSSCK